METANDIVHFLGVTGLLAYITGLVGLATAARGAIKGSLSLSITGLAVVLFAVVQAIMQISYGNLR